MADFAPQPSEFEYPYYDVRAAYDDSLEAAINANEAKADNALPMQPFLANDTSIDTLLDPGIYPCASAFAGAGAVPGGGAGIYFVYRRAGNTVLQIFQSMATGLVTGVEWSRRVDGGIPGAWRVNASQRVDNTAGRAIYTWDETANRETLVSYDSGWRDVTDELLDPVWQPAGGATGGAFIRRIGSFVHARIRIQPKEGGTLIGTNVSGTNTIFRALPARFTPSTYATYGVGTMGTTVPITLNSLSSLSEIAGSINTIFTGTWAAQTVSAEFAWSTDTPTPATLPGTAVGTIPFN